MWRKAASVGGLTLVSRAFGFVRDVMMAALLGAGPLADAFMVAFRLPNHFRAIFAEGAFNAAFVPGYARALTKEGEAAAKEFAEDVLAITLTAQFVLLILAMAFTPYVVSALAPGFSDDPAQLSLTATLTRITFPYLLLISAMTLVAGVLNAHDRFAAAASASILLNVCMIGALLCASWFPTVAHALAWGVLVSGFAQLALVWSDLLKAGKRLSLKLPRITANVRSFLKGFGPAVLGSAGVQIAMFADTILASLLPTGSVSYLYYADRLYQLPLAVVGIAVGTVLLPELSRRLAADDKAGARDRLNRALEGAMLMTLPFVALFAAAPEPIVAALFGRGAFDAAAVAGSAAALQAYAVGLPAIVALRCVTPAFYAAGDTATPVKALALATLVNIALKLALVGTYASAGLAFATAIGACVNVALLSWLLRGRGGFEPDRRFVINLLGYGLATVASIAAIRWSLAPAAELKGLIPAFPDIAPAALIGVVGLGAYGAVALPSLLLARRAAGRTAR
ncbi:murein biosynthesis integral membrane protein MurJ [Chenggangzhangella methanolivorans]|uniref:Probable lipid II flippase MurJ n=1 Tax=Chenggangzhangella methanolivorans TaxID=1437009 RepID=A0A9E6UMB2_9HYPH|nr:murein biosynthesis integral membrane protein MurJ [Chenggangzhangella methanolivorans]QZN99865.1 murein biosynthesis integral membrane protein MurJ [Chenggangzhangella methanolivorans]